MKAWNVKTIAIDEGISVRANLLVEDFGLSNSVRFADALIAATAIEQQQALMTANARHYRCIPALELVTFRP
jgi:predicted nucleic acid-binding protein